MWVCPPRPSNEKPSERSTRPPLAAAPRCVEPTTRPQGATGATGSTGSVGATGLTGVTGYVICGQ